MSYPVFTGKHTLDAVVTPAEMVAHRQRGGRLPASVSFDAAVICLQRGLPERLRRQTRIRRVGHLMGDLYSVDATRGRVAVLTNLGLGAPMVASQADELLALGAAPAGLDRAVGRDPARPGAGRGRRRRRGHSRRGHVAPLPPAGARGRARRRVTGGAHECAVGPRT